MSTMRRILPTLFVVVVLNLQVSSLSAKQAVEGKVALDDSAKGKILLKVDGDDVAEYVYQDAKISRPYFAKLQTPQGPQVSRNHPPVEGADRTDHPTFHPGLWMAFGDISGNDYWRLEAPVKQTSYEIDSSGSSFTVHNQYLDQQDASKIVCEEDCTFTVIVRPAGYLLVWDSSFSSAKPFYFGDQEEMGLGFRVATPISVKSGLAAPAPPGNGKMLDSAGRVNGEEIWGEAADWCDFSGDLDGSKVGMTLFCHPKNFRPSWFHARDYGLLVANPFGQKAFGKGEASRIEVQPGETFRLRYGVFVHAGEGNSPDLAIEYARYLRAAKE